LLRPGGVAFIVSRTFIEAPVALLRRQLRNANLGFAFADVVGGYGGAPTRFEAEGSLCLVKDKRQDLPARLSELMESDWPLFRRYANDPATSLHEKTQAYERAKRVDYKATSAV